MPWFYYRYNAIGVIRISGVDRYKFLQELTTNDLNRLSPEQAVFTVLTNAAGRILDLLTVLEDEDSLILITQNGYAETTLEHLRSKAFPSANGEPLANLRKTPSKYDIALSDESNGWDVAVLLPGEESPPGGLEKPSQTGYVQRFQNRSAAVALPPVLGGGLLLLQPRGVTVMVMLQAQWLDDVSFETERIRRGIPGPGTELTAEFSPFEVGLQEMVAFNKPQFTGKAILLNENRHKERGGTLMGVTLETPIEPPATIRLGEQQIGHITSATRVLGDPPHALAVVRRRYALDGVAVVVGAPSASSGQTGRLTRLPWQKEKT